MEVTDSERLRGFQLMKHGSWAIKRSRARCDGATEETRKNQGDGNHRERTGEGNHDNPRPAYERARKKIQLRLHRYASRLLNRAPAFCTTFEAAAQSKEL